VSASLDHRLNQVLPKITSDSFLSNEGIGNEIACYIFDYSAAEELQVRDHIEWMMDRFSSHYPGLKVLHLNLFDVAINYLKSRGLFDKALKMEEAKGDVAVLQALRGPLAAEKVKDFIAEEYKPNEYDLLLFSGVGSAWPMMRAHNLLNCLHTIMEHTPLVMFYPGTFDGTTLKLFGNIAAGHSKPGTKPYYRAFILIPGDSQS